jgi:hypothetical protein
MDVKMSHASVLGGIFRKSLIVNSWFCSRVTIDDRIRLSTRWTGTDTVWLRKNPYHAVTLFAEIPMGAADLAMPPSRSSTSRRCKEDDRGAGVRRRRAKGPCEESREPPEASREGRSQPKQRQKPKHWSRTIFRDFDRHPVHWTRRHLAGTRALQGEPNDAIRGLLLCRWLPMQTGGLRYSPHRFNYVYRFLRDHCATVLLCPTSSSRPAAAARGRSLSKKRRRRGG